MKRLSFVATLALMFVCGGSRSVLAQETVTLEFIGEIPYIKVRQFNLNRTNSDLAISIPYPEYIIRRITVTKASVSLTGSSATVGLFTATGGGGTAIVPLTSVAALATSTRYADASLAANKDYATASTLYLRNGASHGSAANILVMIYLEPLP